MLEVGQRVVCLVPAERWAPKIEGETMPDKGVVYTIRGIEPNGNSYIGPVVGLWLEEIVNPPLRGGIETYFDANGFRPLKKTDISVFQSLLAPIETAKRKLEKV